MGQARGRARAGMGRGSGRRTQVCARGEAHGCAVARRHAPDGRSPTEERPLSSTPLHSFLNPKTPKEERPFSTPLHSRCPEMHAAATVAAEEVGRRAGGGRRRGARGEVRHCEPSSAQPAHVPRPATHVRLGRSPAHATHSPTPPGLACSHTRHPIDARAPATTAPLPRGGPAGRSRTSPPEPLTALA
jgi:hypothetical protein